MLKGSALFFQGSMRRRMQPHLSRIQLLPAIQNSQNEVLHSESFEWLEEVEFWKDEAGFFYALILEKTKQNPLAFKSKEAKDVEKHLIHVSAEKIDDLKMEIQAHERFLSKLMDNPKLDEELYRSRHKAITGKIHA